MKKFTLIAFALAISTFAFNSYAEDTTESSDTGSYDESYGGGDPVASVKTNIDLTLKNYGNNSTATEMVNIDSSSVDVGSAGNTALLEGTVENFSMAAESYGSNSTHAALENVSASTVGVISAGNAVTLR